MILPVKAGAEALDRTDDLAQAWLFAADAGADVIVSVTADLGYSSFMRQAVDSIWKRGVLMVEASNDFDSTDHQGGMFWPTCSPATGWSSTRRASADDRANRDHDVPGAVQLHLLGNPQHVLGGDHGWHHLRVDADRGRRCRAAARPTARPRPTQDIRSPRRSRTRRRSRSCARRHPTSMTRPAVARQARVGSAVRLRPPERLGGHAGRVAGQHPAGRPGSTRPTGTPCTTRPRRQPCR